MVKKQPNKREEKRSFFRVACQNPTQKQKKSPHEKHGSVRPWPPSSRTHFQQIQHPSAEARGGGNSSSSSKEEEENVPSAVRKFSTGLLRWWCGACCRVPPGHLAYLVQLFPTKEGRRSTPRVREPAPAVEGLFKRFKGAHFSRTSPPPSDSGRKTNSLQNTPPPRKSGTIR